MAASYNENSPEDLLDWELSQVHESIFKSELAGPKMFGKIPSIEDVRDGILIQCYQIVSPEVAKKFQKMPKSEFWQRNSPHFSNLAKNMQCIDITYAMYVVFKGV